MRPKLIAVAMILFTQVGCAGGFRIGGNRFGAGIGAYIGPVPDVIKNERCDYRPPATVPIEVPQR